MTEPARIPVHILTGFLGSGKTTLLNEALRAGLGAETAVVVNEFGDAGLDQLFLQSSSEETVVLKSGCVCCTLRGDLPATLLALLAQRGDVGAPFSRVVIETSGIAEPLPILQTLRSDPMLRTRFRAGSIVCTAGATGDPDAALRAEARAQITAADAIVITKRDLVPPDAAAAVERAATRLNPLAEIVAATGADFVAWLDRSDAANGDAALATRFLPASASPGPPGHGVRSIVIRAAAPPSWPKFAVWLTRLIFVHGERILRTKGVLYDPARDAWIGIHGVKRYFHPPVHLTPAQAPPDGTCLVFITEDLDPGRIAESYRRMVDAAPAEGSPGAR